MYDVVQVTQHFVQSIIYILSSVFAKFLKNFCFTPKIRQCTVKTEPCRMKTAEIRLISLCFRSILQDFTVKRHDFTRFQAKFTGFCKCAAVFGWISPVSTVNIRVPRDLSAVGKIPGKSQHGNAELKNPETLPPVALRLSGACRFHAPAPHMKNYECAIFLERVFSRFGVCHKTRSNCSDYQ